MKEHLENFNTYCEVSGVDHEDVAVRMFVKTFIAAMLYWYSSLPNGSITSWDNLLDAFQTQFKSRVLGIELINEISHIKKKYRELTPQIINHFNKIF